MICKPVWGTQHSSFLLSVYASYSSRYNNIVILYEPFRPYSFCRLLLPLPAFSALPQRLLRRSLPRLPLFFATFPFFPRFALSCAVNASPFRFSFFHFCRLAFPSFRPVFPFPPQKKLRPGRQSRAVLLPESNVHSFASDGESLQTKPQAMQFTSGAELFRQFCFSKTAAKPAT